MPTVRDELTLAMDRVNDLEEENANLRSTCKRLNAEKLEYRQHINDLRAALYIRKTERERANARILEVA